MTGASGPAILTYIRYHTDAEVRAAASRPSSQRSRSVGSRRRSAPRFSPACGNWPARIRRWRQAVLPDAVVVGAVAEAAAAGEQVHLLPRPRAAAPARGVAAASVTVTRDSKVCSRRRSRWPMAVRARASCLRSRKCRPCCSRTDATRCSRRTGRAYREKADHAESRLDALRRQSHGQSLQPARARSIRRTCNGSARRGCFRLPSNPRALQSTPVVQDGIMYVTGWNEIYALDATTGRQLWTYSEARHDGILSEARHRHQSRRDHRRRQGVHGDRPCAPAGLQPLHGTEAVGRRDGLARGVLQLDLAAASRRRPARRRRRRWRGRRPRIPRCLSRVDRRARLALVLDPEARREGLGDVDRPGARARVRRDVDAGLVRSAARLDLLGDRQSLSGHRRRRAHRRQPLHVERRRARGEDRRDEVVLPVHAARHARLGCGAADAARRRECGRGSRASC